MPGITSGSSSNVLIAGPSAMRWRIKARLAGTPSTRPIKVADTPTCRLRMKPSTKGLLFAAAWNHLSE